LRKGLFLSSPDPERIPGLFKLCSEGCSSVTVVRPTTPGSSSDLFETRALNPIVLKTKEFGFGDGGGDINLQRNVVGGGSSKRGENSTRKHLIPGEVNKHSVKPLESWGGTLVGPSEAPIEERQLKETHFVDAIIERLGLIYPKVRIILLVSVPNHIEISTEHPRSIGGRRNRFEFI
jgi:hypothetical protein